MLEIIGKHNTAKCYTGWIEDAARKQIQAILDEEIFSSSKIRIMPDVHAGKSCTIGTTMTITDKIVPAMVGVDIGCGMYTVFLGKCDIDLEKFDEEAHKIPAGQSVWETPYESFDLTKLRCFGALKRLTWLACSLGTLGGGNHFIELDEDEDGNRYLVIHSGSRNLGVQVAEHYQALAVELRRGREEYFQKRADIIRTYKAEGRQQEIQGALTALQAAWETAVPSLPPDHCYLDGRYMEDYIHDVNIAQQFAWRSREIMAESLLKNMGLTAIDAFHTIHNYIDVHEMILRKGAISAKQGERILIPINMRDGSLLCVGRGNEDWNTSAPHGAGRLLSRSGAVQTLTMEEYQAQMAGIYSTCITPSTLDESPMAYKSMAEIVENIHPTATILKRIKPIYNFKASE